MRISDWSSDVCSSDLLASRVAQLDAALDLARRAPVQIIHRAACGDDATGLLQIGAVKAGDDPARALRRLAAHQGEVSGHLGERSEEHTSELQSLMRISYAVFCLKKKKATNKELKISEKQK